MSRHLNIRFILHLKQQSFGGALEECKSELWEELSAEISNSKIGHLSLSIYGVNLTLKITHSFF
jgi:hypothetical protein